MMKADELRTAWTSRFRKPIAARFVWQALSPAEQHLLFHTLTSFEETGIGCEALQVKTGINSSQFSQALARIESLLLVEIIKHEAGGEVTIVGYREYGDTLLQVGKEIFFGTDRSQLTLTQRLTQLDTSSRSLLIVSYGIMFPKIPDTTWQVSFLKALVHRGRIFAELKKLDWHLQYLVALAYECGGKITFAEADAALHLPASIWYDLLTLAEELCLIFDTLNLSGQRVLFLPKDLYEMTLHAGYAPLACQQLNDAVRPAHIRKGNLFWLYNLAVLVGTIFQEEIEASTLYEQYSHHLPEELLSMLQGLPRADAAGGDQRIEMVCDLAHSLHLAQKVHVVMGGSKVFCQPGEYLQEWSHTDIATQTRRILLMWQRSSRWIDLIGIPSQQIDRVVWNRDERSTYARKALVTYLRGLSPNRWYSISSLHSSLYIHHSDIFQPSFFSYDGKRHSSSATASGPNYHQWQQHEGIYFAGMLASSLFELGIINLGYQQDPGDLASTKSLSPDLFQVTDLGYTVLTYIWEDADDKQSSSPLPKTLDVAAGDETILVSTDIAAIYRLLPFSHIIQIGRESRLKITRSSIYRGMAYGMSFDQILKTLLDLSQQNLPVEIVSIIQEWSEDAPSRYDNQLLPLDIQPAQIEEGETKLLFDLAILTGVLYQEEISSTDQGTLPKRFVKNIRPLLRGKPRLNAMQEDGYLQMLLDEAVHHGLLSKSQTSTWGKKVKYNRGYGYAKWAASSLAAQMQQTLSWWTSSFSSPWKDVPGPRFTLWGKTDWNAQVAVSRTLLLNYLSLCKPHQWYRIDTLLDTIWIRDPYALRPDRLREMNDEASKRRKLRREHWDLCEGELYRGMISSSLFEFGIVALGASSVNNRQSFDSFCLTDLGAIALAHWQGQVFQPRETQTSRASVVVLPTFQILLLEPDIPVLYRLLEFAQIEQVAQVSKLLLTQASVKHATSHGWSHEQILSTVSELTSKELPQNVVYTLCRWT